MFGLFGNFSLPIGHLVVLNAGGWADTVPGLNGDDIRVRPGGQASVSLLFGGHGG